MKLLVSLASKTQTPRPSVPASRSDLSASFASARGMTVSENPVRCALPGAEVERLVPEEDVVGPCGSGEPRGRGLPRLDPRFGLALVERSRFVPAPRDLRAHQQHERGDEHRRPLAREVDQPERDEEREERQHEDQVARLGRRRLAEPREDERSRGHQHDAGRQERRVAISAPQGTCADDRDREHAITTGVNPAVKSPATRYRYASTAPGPSSFCPPAPTPTSNRPARTWSLYQKGDPRTATAAIATNAAACARARVHTRPAWRARALHRGASRPSPGSRPPRAPSVFGRPSRPRPGRRRTTARS